MENVFFKPFYLEEYKKVESQNDLNTFFDAVGNFHDSLIKEIHCVNDGFIDFDKSMNCEFKLNLRLFIQSQWIGGIELVLEKVTHIKLDDYGEIYNASGAFEKNELTKELELLIKIDSNVIKCKKLFYKIEKNTIGQKTIFGDFIVPEEIEEIKPEDGYLICPNCLNDWKFDNRLVAKCSKCGAAFKVNQ